MNGLEEIRECIKDFICKKEQVQKKITKIEEKRTQLAQKRNEKKRFNGNWAEINELGKQISELGNQSQELQNKLDFKFHEIKSQVNLIIDNSIAEGIRKIRQISEEIKNEARTEKEITNLKAQKTQIEDEITLLARTKREIKNGNWKSIIEEDSTEEIYIEELNVEEMEPIEEIYVEEMEKIEELYVEEFKPVEEIEVEEFREVEELKTDTFEQIKETPDDEISKLARAIVEEIAAEQTRDYNVNEIEKEQIKTSEKQIIEEQPDEEEPEDIIIFEQEENVPKSKTIIPLFGKRATISNITIKFEEGNLVYKAQMSDNEEVKIYPSQLGEKSVLLRDKQNREECKEILIKYTISEHKVLDKKVINKIDPLICELLIECAERYGYNAQELIYNYALSFTDGDVELVPEIIYNLSYIEQSNLSRKEKSIIKKICKEARKNLEIEIIGAFFGFSKIKYVFKRLFAINNVNVLPEAKY